MTKSKSREAQKGGGESSPREPSQAAQLKADNQITCTHRINYQSGRDCATPTEGAIRVGKGCYTLTSVSARRGGEGDRGWTEAADCARPRRHRRRRCLRLSRVSSDPATVIFSPCVGVREREFTPHGSVRRVQARGRIARVRCGSSSHVFTRSRRYSASPNRHRVKPGDENLTRGRGL